jgi:hypothetical protein
MSTIYTAADELEADQAARVRQKAEEWHAAYCKDQAAGDCLRVEHLGEKDGFIAGFEAAERSIPVQPSEPQVLGAILAELKHIRAASASTARSSVELAETAKGAVQLSVKSYQDSPIVDAGINAIAEFGLLKREIERQQARQWQVTVDALAAKQSGVDG